MKQISFYFFCTFIFLFGKDAMAAPFALFSTSPLQQQSRVLPLNIWATQLIVDQKDNSLIFQNNVEVRRGINHLFADQVKIFSNVVKKTQLQPQKLLSRLDVLKGQNEQIDRVYATGNVRLKTLDYQIVAQKLIYQSQENKIELQGAPLTIFQAQNRLQGCQLIIETRTGNTTLTPCQKKEQIQVDIQPQKL